MTRAVHIGRPARHDKPTGTVAAPHERGVVTRFALVAATMPSVLARLRPMDATSDRIRHFLTMATAARSARALYPRSHDRGLCP